MNTVKAAVFMGVETPFEIKEFPVVEAPAGMAGIKMIASGVCGTDIHFHHGKIPLVAPKIIGHEMVGCIDQISPEDSEKYGLKKGDNVIVDIASPCGECLLCKNGDDANCVNMGVTNGGDPNESPYLWGGYADYNFTPVKNLIKIPESLDPTLVCVYACAGPTALHAFSLARKGGNRLEDAKVAVVQGLGPVGTFAVAYLASLGIPNVVAISLERDEVRDSLASKLGATEILYLKEMTDAEMTAHIKELSGGLGADIVFEASGSPKAVPTGMGLLRNRGLYLIPGQYSNSGEIAILPQLITFNALQLIGSSQYSVSDVETYLEFVAEHTELHPVINSLITAYPLNEVNLAFDDAKARKNVKTVLTPSV